MYERGLHWRDSKLKEEPGFCLPVKRIWAIRY